MRKLGWYLQPQLASTTSPENIHISVGSANLPHIDAMLHDLEDCLNALEQEPATGTDLPDMQALGAMLATATPEQLGQLMATLGIQGGSLPGDLEPINQVLNALPVPLRDKLLVDYFNTLFNS
jgi:sphinganine-1-phosphate aldolase